MTGAGKEPHVPYGRAGDLGRLQKQKMSGLDAGHARRTSHVLYGRGGFWSAGYREHRRFGSLGLGLGSEKSFKVRERVKKG